MKEFIKSQKVTYNLMSFTGYKALLLFNLLTESPKTYEEISNYLFNHPYLREKISIDTLRVYINSLKRIGCDVKRIKGEDKISRYFISSNPFELQLSDDEIQSIAKIYKNIVQNINIQELLNMDNFIEKISKYTKNENIFLSITKYSPIKGIDKDKIKELLALCKEKHQITIEYNSPNSGIKFINIITDKLDISNGKVYLYGTGLEYNQYASFLVNRIKSIKNVMSNNIYQIPNEIEITYKLNCKSENVIIDTNEKIIEENDKYTIIQVKTSNDFFITQKLLEYGPLCTILNPTSYKEKFIKILKDMKAGYNYD